MTNKLTQKIAREYVRILGGTLKGNEYREFVVGFGETEYFTQNLEHAISTAATKSQGSNEEKERAETFLRDSLA